jgi:nitrous oxidase accessory protein
MNYSNNFDKNYWSQYEGYDLDRDGVGDVPHRPVRLFSILVEKQPQALLLLRSLLIDILDAAEKFMPALTPETLIDSKPKMEPVL